MMRYSGLAISIMSLLSLCVLSSCGNTASGPQTITSSDGLAQIEIPGNWNVMTDLNDEADIQVGSDKESVWLLVLSEPKIDFDSSMTYKSHAELTIGLLMDGMKNPFISDGPTDLQINGRPAVQYEVQGSVDGIQTVWIHTTVDGIYSFHQIATYTTPSRIEQNRPAMESVTNSFKEITY